MKVGFYHERASFWDAGGIAMFVQEMARALSDSHTVYLYSGQGDPSTELAESDVEVVQIEPLPHRGALDRLLSYTPLTGQLRSKLLTFAGGVRNDLVEHAERHVDVMLTHQYLDDLLLSNVLDVPVAYEYHGARSPGIGATVRERFTATRHHLANSAFTAENVEELFGRDVDAVVTPGVDTTAFSREAEPAFRCDETAVLFVGRVVEEKGIFDLIEAFKAVDDARLYVVGGGELNRARTRARDVGVADRITFTGVVSHDRLPDHYAAADIVCQPSRYESFGMANLEAMACGRPLVAADVGGVREYASHGDNCLLVQPGDVEEISTRLDELAGAPARRRRLGAAARATAEEYNWAACADRLAAVCEWIIDCADSATQRGRTRALLGGSSE